jgi:hypothetical protein
MGHRWYYTTWVQPTLVDDTPQSMDALVPPDVTAELTQILSNLVLGDNEIRSKYPFSLHSLPPSLTFRPVQRLSSMSVLLTDLMSISWLSPSLLQERTQSKWYVIFSPLYPCLLIAL